MRKRMIPVRGAFGSRHLASNTTVSSPSSFSSNQTEVKETPLIEGTPLILPASPPRGSPPPPASDPNLPPEAPPTRRRRIEVGSPSVTRGAIVPVVGLPGCPACLVFIQSLSYLREDQVKIMEELEQARISERVNEELRRLATVERCRMEDIVNNMRLSYDRLREECHALHLRMDSSHDPSFISGGRQALNTLLEFGVITRDAMDSCGMSYFLGPV